MGTISHDAIIVTGYDEHVDEAREKVLAIARDMPRPEPITEDWEGLVSPVLQSLTNGYCSFFVAPDGSKEWWGTSDRGDDFRSQVVEALAGDGYLTVIQVRYGERGDEIRRGQVPNGAASERSRARK